MKGLTPVIAIILLLLMTVAAAGSFYFLYQSFTSSGEESGSSQMEQLSEQSLSAIEIESVGGGKIYVRNVGASTIDASKLTVYVDDVPVDANVSSSTLTEGGRVTIELTQVPSCTDKCSVRIGGAATTSRTVDDYLLVPTDSCGDGTCSETETGITCYADCGLRSFLVMESDENVYQYDWDGTTYAQSGAVTDTGDNMLLSNNFDSQGNALAIGARGDDESREIIWASYDGSEWSGLTNLTDNEWRDEWYFDMAAFLSNDSAYVTWRSGENKDITVAYYEDGSWSAPFNLTNNTGGDLGVSSPAIDCVYADGYGDVCMVVWMSAVNTVGSYYDVWVNRSFFINGAWETIEPDSDSNVTYLNTTDVDSLSADGMFNSTHVLMVWAANYPGQGESVVQYKASPYGSNPAEAPLVNASSKGEYGFVSLELDSEGTWILNTQHQGGGFDTTWPEIYTWDDGWSSIGNLSSNPTGWFLTFQNEHGAILGVIGTQFTYWTGDGWAEMTDLA